ncbi:hypothetical protein [Kineosporia succinea]|uniref:Uncharacterized protein n=1 Tax=Kineosporia succinea TaxID=84632 RepID=A0ABT9P4Y3_9ACTN|nr:hypothetical protein [Kineosporia succinea]MDP9827753.1 hypothetical protein [Kineosporia succinea]
MTQQPSWTRFSLHLVEFVVLAAALAALEFCRRGPLDGRPFLWTGLALVVVGVALLSGLSHAALGMAKARSADPDTYEDVSW